MAPVSADGTLMLDFYFLTYIHCHTSALEI